jgi:hypothetical protein
MVSKSRVFAPQIHISHTVGGHFLTRRSQQAMKNYLKKPCEVKHAGPFISERIGKQKIGN